MIEERDERGSDRDHHARRNVHQVVPPLTPKTITQPDRLLKELESARINGYAMDDGEVEQGLICVAAPVRDASGRVIAAVSIAGPDYRMEQDMEMMIREIRQTAERISYAHGFFR